MEFSTNGGHDLVGPASLQIFHVHPTLLTAAYRGEFQIAGLAEAARRFQVLRNSEANSAGKGLVMELEGSGRRAGGGARVVFRASAD